MRGSIQIAACPTTIKPWRCCRDLGTSGTHVQQSFAVALFHTPKRLEEFSMRDCVSREKNSATTARRKLLPAESQARQDVPARTGVQQMLEQNREQKRTLHLHLLFHLLLPLLKKS